MKVMVHVPQMKWQHYWQICTFMHILINYLEITLATCASFNGAESHMEHINDFLFLDPARIDSHFLSIFEIKTINQIINWLKISIMKKKTTYFHNHQIHMCQVHAWQNKKCFVLMSHRMLNILIRCCWATTCHFKTANSVK